MTATWSPALTCSCCSRSSRDRREDCESALSRVTDPQALEIITAVLLATNMRPSVVFSSLRTHRIAMTRALIAARLRAELQYSYPEIGHVLGRDHSSVIAMVRKVRAIVGGPWSQTT